MLAIVLTFGIHSLVDWTWFIPVTAIAGLDCAGWLTGRGPLASPIGHLNRNRKLSRSPSAAIAIASILVIALAAVWVTIEPLRSADADSAALAAAIRGNAGAALTDARTAAADDPVSVDPLNLMSTIYSRLGDLHAARRELVDAASRQPSNPDVWERLGCFDLSQHRTSDSTIEFHRVLILDPGQLVLEANPSVFCASFTG